ncbi:Beta-ketoacyl-acyl-carrier-protein synthase I [Phaeobacter sp. CECT 5382]|uniref:type I polyketide synthase n=1 Tax=Phaeobacter sp. CECT 5382 TaxID=1712645 RepID=UPI0006DAFC48|nr:type I polyketide synthase [Phaeobacter sp. CECT 5382]CUH87521.1 Beta-ketoacyl-acyl-carrier-protein synthase I [Phaeobacter sp. CECT 5382]
MTQTPDSSAPAYSGDIAIVGMSVNVPGAEGVDAYWHNLRAGIESIVPLSEEDLLAAGVTPETLADPNYVRHAALLDGFADFDAEFFGFSPKEAAILDPQHRKFLEVAWGAMENAAHPPETLQEPIGVYGGCGMGSYFYFNICSNPGLVDEVGMFLLRHTGNDKDFLTTRVSHVFDLKGPSVNIQTACSTSLVAVHYACKALRAGECGMALAGGVTIDMPQGRGYLYKENEILSPDGHCHAFDHRAQGTVFGSGAGAVALRRLEDAQADGDHIWAVIKGSAINNDGADKAGYLAPSVGGQTAAIRQALAAADISAETIDYVECHGTGTYLGDPIEVSALTEAYNADTDATGYCRIGSVKTNIGHLDTAAGIAGLIKTSLALTQGEIPPSLSYEAPNPAIDFDTSPFRVNAELAPWISHKGPRRAAINALGVGGTNAHAILEEAPQRAASEESDFPFHVLCLSGQSKSALAANSAALADYLEANPDVDMADVAYTLKEGRRGFAKRRVLVAESAAEAAALLREGDPRQVFSHDRLGDTPEVVFSFPGGGAQYAGMARDLYETEPVFADWMDRGLDHLQPQLDYDIRALWLPEAGDEVAADAELQKPSVQLPLIMIVEYALAQLWISWGIRPAALVGHSMGENTAACLAGVISFEDCIDLVLLRGRLFDRVPAGGMLSIALPLAEVAALISADLDIASVNAPSLTAVSGPQDALDTLAQRLTAQEVDFQRIQIDIAAHSRMLDGILSEYRDFLSELSLSAPQIPVISNRSGQLLTPQQAMDPDYWVGQLRNTVRFADCMETLAATPGRVFLEVGPGKALSALAQLSPNIKPGQVLSALRHPDQQIMDDAYFFGVIGRLWACGVEADWDQIWGEAKRRRLPLPGYQFQRSRYFIAPGTTQQQESTPLPRRHDNIADWGYRPAWRPRLADCEYDIDTDLAEASQNWLIFADDCGLATATSARLRAAGHQVSLVRAGDTYAKLADGDYILPPEQGRFGYAALLADLADSGAMPNRIAHFWLVTNEEIFRPGSSFFDRNLEMGFASLTALAQELGGLDLADPIHLSVFTTGAAQVAHEALPYPEKALIAGPVGVIPREFPQITCSAIDIELPQQPGLLAALRGAEATDLTPRLLEELLAEPQNSIVAWRGNKRLEKSWRALTLPDATTELTPKSAAETAPNNMGFKTGGIYLITGGYGGIGFSVAAHLMQHHDAKIALLSRDGLPPRNTWDQYLTTHGPSDRLAQRIRAIQDLEQIGTGAVLPLAADVCNSGDMRAALTEIESRFGAPDGVIHAAGHIDDGPILAKSESQIAAVLAPKVTGLRVLEALFPDGSLDLMVLFSSSSTVTWPAGQIDYVAANEYLNAWAAHRQGSKTRVVTVDWGVWADTGMAAEALAARQGGKGPTEPRDCAQPLLEQTQFDGFGNPVFTSRLSAQQDWLLDEHRTKSGTALIPGTGYIEWAAEALAALDLKTPFEIRDLYFLRPLVVQEAHPRDMVLRLSPPASQTPAAGAATQYDLAIHSSLSSEGYALNAEARVALLPDSSLPASSLQDSSLPGSPAPKTLDLAEIAARCPDVTSGTPATPLRSPQQAHLKFGPRWQVLEHMALGTDEGLAQLRLPAAAAQDHCLLHPGLMDLATGWAISLVPGYDGSALWVPVSYQMIRVFAPLTDQIHSHMRLNPGSDATSASFDITLSDADGTVLVEIEGFQMTRLVAGFEATAPQSEADTDAQALGLVASPATQPLSEAERRLQINMRNGIRAAEGPAALERALNCALTSNRSQVVISSLELPALIAQTDQSTTEAAADESQTFERPDLDTDYIAPSNPVEESLAALFQSLLGVAQVGVADSFFDLGGHSLIAVRLFAQIKRQFDVDFALSVLFEAPSVAKLAQLVIQAGGTGTQTSTGGGAEPAAADAPRYTHLVQLHPGPAPGNVDTSPLFLVAGMFGNVLNLRHLAQILGTDRPIYGLQAKGLIGAETPHDTIEAAARDYLAEIKQIQPEGPYLLGGFSGGGITAYEMAQQVQAAGDDVAALILLDTPLPVRPGLNQADKALIKLQELRKKGAGYLLEWAKNRILWEISKRRARPAESGTAPSFNNRKIELAFRQAVEVYDLKPWQGPVTLLRPPLDLHWQVSRGNWVSQEREYVFADNDWSRWAPTLEVVEVPGDHDSMVLLPNASTLAAAIQTRLDPGEPDPGRSAPKPDADQTYAQAAE